MDMWYLVSLVTHLNWPGFLDIAEYLQNQNLVCSSQVSIESMVEWSLIIEVDERPYCSSVSMVWWHGYRHYTGFSKQ